jgi:PAS domain S-box-containing protein
MNLFVALGDGENRHAEPSLGGYLRRVGEVGIRYMARGYSPVARRQGMEIPLEADPQRQDDDAGVRQGEARLRECFELGVTGMAITSPVKGCLHANERLCEILGYERSELLRLTWTELTHPDDVDADVAQFDKVMAGEIDGYGMIKRFIRKDGGVIHAAMSVKCHRDTRGSVDYFVAFVEDISESVRADEAARNLRDELSNRIDERGQQLQLANDALIQELGEHCRLESLLRVAVAKFESLVESVTDQFSALDNDWRFVYLNKRAQEQMRALGKDPVALIGTVLWDEFPDVPNEAELRRAMSERTAISEEHYSPQLARWVESHIYPNPSGGLVIFQKYITDRKGAEEALRVSGESLAEAQRLCQCGSEARNVVTGVVLWSDETCRIYGVEPGAVTPSAQLFFSRVHPEDRTSVQHAFEQVVRNKSDYEVRFRVVRPDGTVRQVHSVGRSVLDADGELQEVAGTVMDVTDRVRVEEALAKTRLELARVTRIATMGELTALIAHEVSQPLASIVSNGSAALRWLLHEPAEMDEATVAIERVVDEGNRAGDVIQRLRELATRGSPRMERFHVNEAVEEAISLVKSELASKQISLERKLAPALPTVLGDRVQVAQVILNLVLNAIEAMAEATGATRQIVIASQLHESAMVLVSVVDRGRGFDPPLLDSIFDPFVTTKPEGMGLGLSMSRTIVEQHGGRLWASANNPHGATFSFTLPAAAESAAQ